MDARERIEKLKAARRAELAEAEAEQVRQDLARKRRDEEDFDKGVAAALAKHSAEWLAPYRTTATAKRRSEALSSYVREVLFQPPGEHYEIALTLVETCGGWIESGVQLGEERPSWSARDAFGRCLGQPTLADALIAAEMGRVAVPEF